MDLTIFRRPESPADEAFVHRLIMGCASVELGAAAWPEPMRSHLLGIQNSSRRSSIRNNFPNAESQVIVADGHSVGWLVVAPLAQEIRLVEILISAELRGKGIGSRVIREILATADQQDKPVRLSVNAANRAAIRLYERLGFQVFEDGELQLSMERRANFLKTA
jgi:ribosomal protein S18 acetylase RimI-like enzyme